VINLRRVPLGTELAFSQVSLGSLFIKFVILFSLIKQLNVPVEKYKMVIEIWERYFWRKIRNEVKNNYEALSGL